MNPVVIIPWREGETELQATIESASDSIGKGVVMPVEDKAGDGPAMTRHRGIMAAKQADVIVIVDAHMKFDGPVLRDMAARVARHGGLLCAKCYHNEGCTWEDSATYYAGADIRYMGQDHNGNQGLLWKWSQDQKPGPRACIGGACYVFRRDWYIKTGQCLAALPAWGCDEEALSITAWLSGHDPKVHDGRVAHRWRATAPWPGAARPIQMSRAALICAVVDDPRDRAALLKHQGAQPIETPEVARWRQALSKCPRKWADWKASVPIMPEAAPPRPMKSIANYAALENLRLCPKCNSDKSKVVVTRHVGRITLRYRTCECGRKRVTRQVREIDN